MAGRPRTTQRLGTVLVAPVLVLLALVAEACGDDDGGGSTTTTAAPSPTTEPSTTTVPAEQPQVAVFFVRDEAVATAGRSVTAPAVARGALEALLDGPDDLETGIGMTSAIPAGTELLDVGIADGVATVDLSGEFESGGGSLSMQLRVAQVVFTLTQFPTVDAVDLRLDGEAVDAIGGEGVPATDLDRAEFEGLTPLVLVESPTPGATVTGPFEVSGTSNTFEANVRYELTAADGAVLDEGFTTATAGTGTWGTFAVTVDPGGATGPATLVAFQTDEATGGRADAYEVPLVLG